jgi:hypothetical protein
LPPALCWPLASLLLTMNIYGIHSSETSANCQKIIPLVLINMRTTNRTYLGRICNMWNWCKCMRIKRNRILTYSLGCWKLRQHIYLKRRYTSIIQHGFRFQMITTWSWLVN